MESLKERDNLKDLVVDGIKILKLILRKLCASVCSVLIRLRTVTDAGFLVSFEHGNELSGFIKIGQYFDLMADIQLPHAIGWLQRATNITVLWHCAV
jgi:hypothetical protein